MVEGPSRGSGGRRDGPSRRQWDCPLAHASRQAAVTTYVDSVIGRPGPHPSTRLARVGITRPRDGVFPDVDFSALSIGKKLSLFTRVERVQRGGDEKCQVVQAVC